MTFDVSCCDRFDRVSGFYNVEVVEGGEVDLTVGEVIMVDIKMTNQLLEPVCDAELCVRLLQVCKSR